MTLWPAASALGSPLSRSTDPASTRPACRIARAMARACSRWRMPPGRFRPATTACRVRLLARACTMSTLPTHAPSSAASASSMGKPRAADVAVLAGASSTPALSHAVLDTLVAGSRKVIAIEVSIAPGNRAPRGLEYGACGALHGRPADPRVSRLSLGRGTWMGTEQDDRTSRRWQPQGRAVRNT